MTDTPTPNPPSPTPPGGLLGRLVGVGGAGCRIVEQIASAGELPGTDCVAVNTDLEALRRCPIPQQIQIGSRLTRGLGAGGDPEAGQAAAEESLDPLRALGRGAHIVVVATGLGGGTGTGASPVLAQAAREAGGLVLALATLPFNCEGRRRQRQARAGLELLKAAADAVICLPHQHTLKILDEHTSLLDTFRFTNELLAQGVRGIWRMLSRPGIIQVDFADLAAVLRGRHAESALACVEARGEHRTREVLDKLLASPLLGEGRALAEADSALVSLAAGPGLTVAEIDRLMGQLERHCEQAQIVLGAQIDEALEDQLALTVIATRHEQLAPPARLRGATASDAAQDLSHPSGPTPPPETEAFQTSSGPRAPSRFVAPPPELTGEQQEALLAQQTSPKTGRPSRSTLRQGLLPLEVKSRGRFDKSEPTIYRGEDLDVPTYIRRGIPLN
jgi:cell division protein FtsZ